MKEPIRTDSKTSCADLQKVSSSGREGTKASLLEWQCVDFMQAEEKELCKKMPPIFLLYCIKKRCENPFFPSSRSAVGSLLPGVVIGQGGTESKRYC